MNPIRKIIQDAPDAVSIPPELRHRAIELIIRPLEESLTDAKITGPEFLIADVAQVIMPTREQRSARR
jgi:hypothetical protein